MQEVICIVCPKGCHLNVDEENDFAVTGNACEKGIEYGRNELLDPVRVLTSTVRIEGSEEIARCPVRTNGSIPKSMIFEVMEKINSVVMHAPVSVGDVVIPDVLGTGVDIIATRSVKN